MEVARQADRVPGGDPWDLKALRACLYRALPPGASPLVYRKRGDSIMSQFTIGPAPYVAWLYKYLIWCETIECWPNKGSNRDRLCDARTPVDYTYKGAQLTGRGGYG